MIHSQKEAAVDIAAGIPNHTAAEVLAHTVVVQAALIAEAQVESIAVHRVGVTLQAQAGAIATVIVTPAAPLAIVQGLTLEVRAAHT